MLKALAMSALGLMLAASQTAAAQLIMVEETYCEWCERWNEEIGVIYDKTPEGKRAPLRRVDMSDGMPDGITFKSRANFTPTFILVEGGEEIGRIEGYPGEHFFWPMLGQLLKKLGRHPNRPAHMHYILSAPGYKTLCTHTFVDDDTYLTSDAVFGVKASLVAHFEETPNGETQWHSPFDFVMVPG